MSNSIKDAELKKFINNDTQTPSVRVAISNSGAAISPLAKYVEAVYSSGDTVVTYSYYESASKVTLYNTIVTTYTTAQDTEFVSASWV